MLEDFGTWVIENKEWLFSGIGVTVSVGVLALIFKKTKASSTQTIRSGGNSTNILAGRDVSIGAEKSRKDVE